MAAGTGVDSVLSMSLFKSPDCAQQVWQWLDKHGDTPVQRERFKHLVSICTVKPVRVPSTQPLQRLSSSQGGSATAAKLSARQHSLATQGSTRFIPEASISHKPAALARPASAAAARLRHEVSRRPSTAAPTPGTSRKAGPAPFSQRSLVSTMRPQIEPKATSRQLSQLTEAVGTAVGPQLNTSAPAALQQRQAIAVPASSLASASAEPVSSIGVRAATAAHSPEAITSSSAALVQTTACQARTQSASAAKVGTNNGPSTLPLAQDSSATAAALQPPQAAKTHRLPSSSSSSRSSNSINTKKSKAGCAPFDTRLALLHKGLPTSLPPSTPSRPASRSSRPSGALQHRTPVKAGVEASLDASKQAAGTAEGLRLDRPSDKAAPPLDCSKAEASSIERLESLNAPTCAQAAVRLQSELNAAKPQSPTSVLPTADLLDTTYHSFYGLAEAYPELYQQAAVAGRAHKANERALVSVLADTLKGDSSVWKKQLCSTYDACNDRLAHDMGWDTIAGLSDQAFLQWVARSQLYSNDLLQPAALQDLSRWMEAAPAAERRDMIALLRDLHASVNPTGPHLKSVSHSVHTKQVPFSNALDQLEKDMAAKSPAATMGPASAHVPAPANSPGLANGPGLATGPALANSPGVSSTPNAAAASLSAQSQPQLSQVHTHAQANPSRLDVPHRPSTPSLFSSAIPQTKKARGINVNAVPCPDTFKSSINLSQGAPPALRSTYTELHASSMPQLMQAVQTVAQQRAQAQKPVLVTAPFGKLDPLMDHAHLNVFPVPSGLLQKAIEPHTAPERSGLDTTQYGQAYCSDLYKGDAAALQAATQRDVAASKAAGMRVTIPVGRKAVNCIPVYNTTYHDEFQPRPFDVARQHASAEHVRSMFHAPTATVGCMTG